MFCVIELDNDFIIFAIICYISLTRLTKTNIMNIVPNKSDAGCVMMWCAVPYGHAYCTPWNEYVHVCHNSKLKAEALPQ